MGEVVHFDGLVEFFDSIRGEEFGVEAVLAGVLIAEGSAALFLARFILATKQSRN